MSACARTLLFLLLLLCGRASAQFQARVQADVICSNLATALNFSNAVATAVATNAPRLQRTASVRVSAEPGGVFRLHFLYEWTSTNNANFLFTSAQGARPSPANSTGRVIFYCQPDEASVPDWSGADQDPRAKRREIVW